MKLWRGQASSKEPMVQIMYALVMGQSTPHVLLWHPIFEWTCLLLVMNIEQNLGSQMCVYDRGIDHCYFCKIFYL